MPVYIEKYKEYVNIEYVQQSIDWMKFVPFSNNHIKRNKIRAK